MHIDFINKGRYTDIQLHLLVLFNIMLKMNNSHAGLISI